MLVCWIDFFLFPSHGLFGLCLSILSHSSLGEGILSCLGRMLVIYAMHLSICISMSFLIFWKIQKIFVYFQGNFGKMCFVCSYFGHFILELHSWMFFFLSGKCMHGLRVLLVDSRILYAKVAGLRTFRGPWSLSSRECGKMELLSIVDLKPLVGICLVIIPCELHLF